MEDSISQDSVPQVPGATASNPFPKMTKEDKIHFVIKDKRKFPKKIFLLFIILVASAVAIAYVTNKNQKAKFANINDVENPKISISQPQNNDTLKGQSNVVVYVADNTINQKAYKSSIASDLKVTSSQKQTITVNIPDDLKKATASQLLYETTGVTNKDQCKVTIVGGKVDSCQPTYDTDSEAQKQTYNAEASQLKTGDNTFEFSAGANNTFSVKSATLVVIFGDETKSGKVVRVEFLLDDKPVGEKTDFTLPFSLDTTKFSNGLHVLVTKAYDEAGNTAISAPRTITIQN